MIQLAVRFIKRMVAGKKLCTIKQFLRLKRGKNDNIPIIYLSLHPLLPDYV